jgi:hypothetical protein
VLDLAKARWVDHPANPLIDPQPPNWMAADPTVLAPDRTPDGKWHLFANGVGFIMHFVSDDGVAWTQRGGRLFRGFRAFLHEEGGVYYLLYELHARTYHRSRIVVRQSADLETWSEPRTLLEPTLPWDGTLPRFIGNPCLRKIEGGYRLYYSSSWIFLRDCLYFEPLYVGIAEAPALHGPYRRDPEPMLRPDPAHPYRNFGAGSFKAYPDGQGGYWGFNNGIYRDAQGRSRSAILLLHSTDGRTFRQVRDEPIVQPDVAPAPPPASPSWKKAFVYAFDLVQYQGQFRLYYNARDGWLRGRERIGVAIAETNVAQAPPPAFRDRERGG